MFKVIVLQRDVQAVGIYNALHWQLAHQSFFICCVKINLQRSFSDEGTNVRKYKNDPYIAFSKYVREAASGRKGTRGSHQIYLALSKVICVAQRF